VDNVVDAIITIDEAGTVETFNRAAETIFGYDASEVIGQNVRMLMPNPDRGRHDGYLSSYIGTGEAKIIGIGRQVTGLRKSGQTFPMELAVSEFRMGQKRFFTGIVRDITERVRAQAEIEQLNAQLRRAMTETHHRVKNNLQIIAAMLDMQAMENVSTVETSEVHRVASHVRTLAQVHDLLTEQSKNDATAEGAPASELLKRLLSLVDVGMRDREIRLHAKQDIWLTTRQATSLALVANELVSNAMKYGEGAIDVTLAVLDQEACLTVEDAGKGFKAGFNAETAANTGLELVNMLVQWDLQGEVAYDNRPSGGARVSVRMPTSWPRAASTGTSARY
jgi:PAS domain S-box-containing protein